MTPGRRYSTISFAGHVGDPASPATGRRDSTVSLSGFHPAASTTPSLSRRSSFNTSRAKLDYLAFSNPKLSNIRLAGKIKEAGYEAAMQTFKWSDGQAGICNIA